MLTSQAAPGFCIPAKEARQTGLAALAAAMRSAMEAAKLPKTLIAEYEGESPLEERGDLRRIESKSRALVHPNNQNPSRR